MIIGITGVKNSGKSTAAKLIREIFGSYGSEEVMLANKLKDLCCEFYNITRQQLEDREVKEGVCGERTLSPEEIRNIFNRFRVVLVPEQYLKMEIKHASPRQFLERVGTSLLRAYNEDIHLENLPWNNINKSVIIVSDVRFPNEGQFIRKRGGRLLYIANSNAESGITQSPSEQAVLETRKLADWVVTNDGKNLENLRMQLDECIADGVEFNKRG